MWSVRPSMNSRLDAPPWEKFWLWKLEGVFVALGHSAAWLKRRFEERSLKK